MPVQQCQSDGKPGYRWGEQGKCYTYTPGDKQSRDRARAKAERQGRAVESEKWLGSILPGLDNGGGDDTLQT